jgi:hypothetical protein
VIRAGYFCSAGHTEAGGMQAFLERIDRTRVTWERCFPAVTKPGPKLGRPAPRPDHEGLSGSGLVGAMLSRLKMRRDRAGTAPFDLDLILFIDDADCRFEADRAGLATWIADRTAEVRAAANHEGIPFIALFASPEIEAWFVADWDAGFGREHARLATGDRPLRAHVEDLLNGPLESVETYGGGFVNGGCASKLSDRLRTLLERLGAGYTKSTDGTTMLRRVRPEKIAAACTTYFRPAWQQLLREIDHLEAPGG